MVFLVAFLRGINSGQHPAQKMENLRKIFEKLGFQNVQTVIASGNVLFETDVTDKDILELRIEKLLKRETGIETPTILRTKEEIQLIIDRNPFKKIQTTKKNKPYATFLKAKPTKSLEMPTNGKGYKILAINEGTVFSIIDLTETRTPTLMSDLEKEFGKNITTRSWNTVKKIASKWQS